MNKKIVVLSAPSGTGKTTIIKHLTTETSNLPLSFSVSATTRAKRLGDVHGKDYYFITDTLFKQQIEDGKFLEYEQVYEGLYYGTYYTELERIWSLNEVPLFDIDVKGAISIKKHYPAESLLLFIKPPSLDVLKSRLMERGTDSPETIQKRLDRAEEELAYTPQFDKVILNDKLEDARKEIENTISEFINTCKPIALLVRYITYNMTC